MNGSFRIINLILLGWIFFHLSGCDRIPADPERSLENAINSGLKAGYILNDPWVIEENGEPSGIEPEIINGFASGNGLKVVWTRGSEQELMKMLEKREIHIVAGGLLKDTPWKSRRAGFSKPYYKNGKEKRVIAVMQGENKLLYRLEKYFEEHKSEIRDKVSQSGTSTEKL